MHAFDFRFAFFLFPFLFLFLFLLGGVLQAFGVVPMSCTMVFRRPNESDLAKRAQKLSKKLVGKYPRQRNVVVYNFNNDPITTGIFFKKFQVSFLRMDERRNEGGLRCKICSLDHNSSALSSQLGTLEVHRSLDRTLPWISRSFAPAAMVGLAMLVASVGLAFF